jgi:hypothetical protein
MQVKRSTLHAENETLRPSWTCTRILLQIIMQVKRSTLHAHAENETLQAHANRWVDENMKRAEKHEI